MANDNSSASYNNHSKLYTSITGAILFIALLVVLGYLNHTLEGIEEKIEDRLAYQPPVTTAADKTANLPVYTTTHAHSIYVPVYSHIYAMGGTPVLLETTLSIRNTDPERSLVITSVNYYDTKGNLVEQYIDGNLKLGPLESTEVLVEKRDTRGGSGANFLVKWNAETPVHLPKVQAVMIGGEGDLKFSFRTNGQPLTTRIDPK